MGDNVVDRDRARRKEQLYKFDLQQKNYAKYESCEGSQATSETGLARPQRSGRHDPERDEHQQITVPIGTLIGVIDVVWHFEKTLPGRAKTNRHEGKAVGPYYYAYINNDQAIRKGGRDKHPAGICFIDRHHVFLVNTHVPKLT